MIYEQLVQLIESIEKDQEIIFETSTFTFGLLRKILQDEDVIMFGGYELHQSLWQLKISSAEEIANGIINHISEYGSDVEGSSCITLDEIVIGE